MSTTHHPPLTIQHSTLSTQHSALEALRGSIRWYVALEGLAVLLLYLAAWFWLGLLLDYGFFKAFTIDWVQELPRGFRAGVLTLFLGGMASVVVVKVLLRLFREFRPAALALVLERRFGPLLGDRLITAVEMADPRLASRYGFSQVMIDQTIQEAAERLDQVPLQEVFNWKRLKIYGGTVAALTLGLYLLLGIGYCLVRQTLAVDHFVLRFHDITMIWVERNLLLANTIWPRRAHLELLNFPEDGDLRVSRTAASAPLRVRALKWVIADADAPEGWRALTWADVTPELLGVPVPTGILPVDWQPRDAQRGLTVDEVEVQLDQSEVVGLMDADALQTLRDLFEQLHERAASPRMSRKLRRLEIPKSLTVYYKGATVRSEMNLQKASEQEYTGVFSDLRESVRFTVRGEDYYTPYRQITVVPPPMLVELVREESRPAYIYHRRPVGGEAGDLRGKKQQFQPAPVSLTGETSRIDVPAGTDVVLTAVADKDLVAVRLLPRAGKGRSATKDKLLTAAIQVPVTLQEDQRRFHARFRNVTELLDFDFEFTDTDGVIDRRHVILRPIEDTGPEVDVLVEVVRKTAQGYMVTPLASIPFSGKVRDDHGLDKVEYAYTVTRLESPLAHGGRAVLAAGAFQFLPGRPAANLLWAPAYLALAGKVIETAVADEEQSPEKVPLETFERRLRERAGEDVPLDVLLQRLRHPPAAQPLLKDHALDPDQEFFDLQRRLPRLKVSDDQEIQPRYRLRLWVVAVDNNIETGPQTSPSKEKFTVLVVSEIELLAEISKEEETLHLKLEDTVNRLKDAKIKLDHVIRELNSPEFKAESFSPLALRAQEIEDVIIKGWDISREVLADYNRILKELKVNRVQPGMIAKVEDTICKPLDGAINQEFVRSEEAQRDFRTTLDQRKPQTKAADLAKERLQHLIDRLQLVLDNMGEITNINKLIRAITAIEQGQRENVGMLTDLKKRIEEELIKRALDPPEKPEKKKP